MAYIDTTYYSTREDVTLNTTDFPTTALVTSWIDQATEEIDRDLERSFDTGTYTETLHKNQFKVPTKTLFLKQTPLTSITQVLIDKNRDSFNPSLEAVNAVILDSSTGMIELQETVCLQEVQAEYIGGYATIPSDVQYLCYLIVKRNQTDIEIRQEVGDDTTTSISSITVRERSSSSLKNKLDRLDKQIEDLKAKIGSMYYIGTY